MHDAPDIRIDRDDVGAEGERRNRTSRIRSDTRQRAQARIVARKFASVFLTDDACEGVQPHRARVVAEPFPRTHDVGLRCRRERGERRPACDERFEERDDAVDLRLLQHKFRDNDTVRRAIGTPRQRRAVVLGEPREQRGRDPMRDDCADGHRLPCH